MKCDCQHQHPTTGKRKKAALCLTTLSLLCLSTCATVPLLFWQIWSWQHLQLHHLKMQIPHLILFTIWIMCRVAVNELLNHKASCRQHWVQWPVLLRVKTPPWRFYFIDSMTWTDRPALKQKVSVSGEQTEDVRGRGGGIRLDLHSLEVSARKICDRMRSSHGSGSLYL